MSDTKTKYKPKLKPFVCAHCKKDFLSIQSKQTYCSIACKNTAFFTGRPSPLDLRVDVACFRCAKIFKRKASHVRLGHQRAFCSHACRKDPAYTACKECGKTFSHQKKFKRVFCGTECHGINLSKRQLGDKNPCWDGGTDQISYGPGWEKVKKKILRRDSKTCQSCLRSAKELGPGNISVHHIKKFKITQDNSPSNLICLCRSCHPKVEKGTIPCPIPRPI